MFYYGDMFCYGDTLQQRKLKGACKKGESFLAKIDFKIATFFRGRAPSF